MRRDISLKGNFNSVTVTGTREAGIHAVTVAGGPARRASIRLLLEDDYELEIDGECTKVSLVSHGGHIFAEAFGRQFTMEIFDPVERAAKLSGGQANDTKSPMPGMVVEIVAVAGQTVCEGDHLLTIESMKLLTRICAWRNGVVEEVCVAHGEAFEKHAVLIRLAPEEEA